MNHLDIIKSEIDRRKKELEDIEYMIKVMEKAGEDTTQLKIQLAQVKAYIARWENALTSA